MGQGRQADLLLSGKRVLTIRFSRRGPAGFAAELWLALRRKKSMQAFVLRITPSEKDRVPEALESNQIIIGWANTEGFYIVGR